MHCFWIKQCINLIKSDSKDIYCLKIACYWEKNELLQSVVKLITLRFLVSTAKNQPTQEPCTQVDLSLKKQLNKEPLQNILFYCHITYTPSSHTTLILTGNSSTLSVFIWCVHRCNFLVAVSCNSCNCVCFLLLRPMSLSLSPPASNQPPRFQNYFFQSYLLVYENTPVGEWLTNTHILLSLYTHWWIFLHILTDELFFSVFIILVHKCWMNHV